MSITTPPEELEPSWSAEGPLCPGCGAKWRADEASYFNENGFELECDECDLVFVVQPVCSWSWTGRALFRRGFGE
jgi:hypothetical protein